MAWYLLGARREDTEGGVAMLENMGLCALVWPVLLCVSTNLGPWPPCSNVQMDITPYSIHFCRTGYLPPCLLVLHVTLMEVFPSCDVGTVKGIHEISILFAMHPLRGRRCH